MSNVTSVVIVVGDSAAGTAEEVAPKVAEAVGACIPELAGDLPVISTAQDDWGFLQGGRKPGGGAIIWFGWNYAHPAELEAHLKEQGFEGVTLWTQDERGGVPRVVSW
ncbi:hypothetical protein OG875_04820 [Streptomyces sp. NBC_01498]|uniref:hypothetical protein n=1 Tax=Streptomyces sp. NBC_01498 TaxID=2975870 RepID=UPI002E7AEA91|nr:hypothetical protein [Streptomyces sp. NBC_01498]WTL23979.1 hypothetical protein OG875_04820 [Streptomyces sp. NBC_01498]